MKIIDKIKNYFKRRNQYKLEESLEERRSDFYKRIIGEVEEILNSKDYIGEEKRNRAIYDVLRNHKGEAKQIGIIEREDDESKLAEKFKGNRDIQNAIRFVKKEELEENINTKINDFLTTEEEFKTIIEEYIYEFCLDENKIKVITEKQKFVIIQEILMRKNTDKNKYEEKLLRLKEIYQNTYFLKIITEKNPREVVRLYNEYTREFLNSDQELEKKFRKCFESDHTILRKIDFLNELEGNINFSSMDKVPELYDMENETINENKNLDIVMEKKDKDVSAEDLVFVRTTQIFPSDGVVETIGKHSNLESIPNPFINILKEIYPDLNEEETELMSYRFRWTSHWCINGIVGNHLMGNFSGRSFIIMEDASEHKDDASLVNILVSDVIYLGDMKLSKKAKIIMSLEKYIELMKDPKNKNQLEKMNIIVYKGNIEEALKAHMNKEGYVWANIDGFCFSKIGTSEEVEYLSKIEDSLRKGSVNGFEHCAYSSDEGMSMDEFDTEGSSKRRVKETIERSCQILGIEMNDAFYEVTLSKMSEKIDNKLCFDICFRYIEYLENEFPEMQGLLKEYIESLKEEEGVERNKFSRLSESAIRKIGIDKIISATKSFNGIIIEEQKAEREKKDKELLDKGFITEEEYNDRKGTKKDERPSTVK